MAYEKFIPELWAEKIEHENDKLLVLAQLTNRQYEGEIAEKGDSVNILGIGPVTIGDYDGGDIADAETLKDTSVKLIIDKSKYFNVMVDDIDKRQGVKGIMEAIMKESNEALAAQEDSDIGKEFLAGAGATIEVSSLTKDNVRGYLQQAKTQLLKNGVTNTTNIVAAITPEFLEKAEQAVETLDTNNSAVVTNGFVGKTAGVDLYVSNNLPVDGDGDDCVFIFTRRAVAHAGQINKVEAYRPDKKFSDAVKGLNLYGTKTVRPKELIRLKIEAYA